MPVGHHPSRQEAGKPDRRSTIMSAGNTNNSYSIRDRNSGRLFLADSGAQFSVFPATDRDRRGPAGGRLAAANQTTINTYGKRTIPLQFGDGHRFEQEFTIADVSRPMLGGDFMDKYNLAVDVRGQRLIKAGEVPASNTICSIIDDNADSESKSRTEIGDEDFFKLLDMYPSILNQNFRDLENKHGSSHYIETTGPPISSRPRRLDQTKLAAAKAEFEELERLGIIRRSNSPWSSPLHVVPKANGKLRPCGDYRRLNAVTKNDKYTLPHIQQFNGNLIDKKVFSKIDLVKG